MENEKRVLEDYEVKSTFLINGKEFIFATDQTKTKGEPYMCCTGTWDNPFGVELYSDAVVSDDYMEIVTEFTKRIDEQVHEVTQQREQRGVGNTPLMSDDCIPGSKAGNYLSEMVVIHPDYMTPSARTADKQLGIAVQGNGCRPEAVGTGVFVENLFTGKTEKWSRYQIAGIIRPDRVPDWAREKYVELHRQKPSVKDMLNDKKGDVKSPSAAGLDEPVAR